ncbi:MAG: molybdopterin biosynthesis protein [Planctomycetes bacterium]|nr:molybdopterin biosynthesis protein [Planctomycetota bacterium]
MLPTDYKQDQFLDVIDRDEAERRFRAVLDLAPLEAEEVALAELLGRVLAADVVAPVDVPSFDRSNVDGYAVRAEDVYGCSEEQPARLQLAGEPILPGAPAHLATVLPRTAVPIATGAMIPRGANAVVMVEDTDLELNRRSEKEGSEGTLLVRRPLAPGANVTFAGTDIGQGETVLRRGEVLTSRETGVLAALGVPGAAVVRRPRVAIVSTGDELIPPGAAMRPGLIYDSNGVVLADAVRELGGEPLPLGIVADDPARLEAVLHRALADGADVLLLSGGTSKGAGDVSYRVVKALGEPGILAHGVALKPGKPLCLAAVRVVRNGVTRTVPVVVLPGFPTSAIFTFREFVAPVIRRLGGRPEAASSVVQARLPFRVNSERGRTEYLLVGLVESLEGDPPLAGYPMGKGSGSVTSFSRADGFVVIPRQREYLEAGEVVPVHLLGQGEVHLPDLVVIGSHCVGLDYLLGLLAREGLRSKVLSVGSTGGLAAARRGECDVAGIHLLDPATSTYNVPYLSEDLELVRGYGRLQGIVFREADARFEGRSVDEAMHAALGDAACVMINRNRGSGTRLLIDRLLRGTQPVGYWTEARTHNAVGAAVAQGRADWGVALGPVARAAGLGFLPLQEEQYDFVVPRTRLDRPAVVAFRRLLQRKEVSEGLQAIGFRP